MEKKRLFQILSRAQRNDVIRLGERIQQQYPVTIVKKPEKSLTMIRMREPVKNSLFYLGEAIITEERLTARSSWLPSKPRANSRTMGYRSAIKTAINPTESKNDMVMT